MTKQSADPFTEFYAGEKLVAATFRYRKIVEAYEELDNAEEFYEKVGDIIGIDEMSR